MPYNSVSSCYYFIIIIIWIIFDSCCCCSSSHYYYYHHHPHYHHTSSSHPSPEKDLVRGMVQQALGDLQPLGGGAHHADFEHLQPLQPCSTVPSSQGPLSGLAPRKPQGSRLAWHSGDSTHWISAVCMCLVNRQKHVSVKNVVTLTFTFRAFSRCF